MLRRIILSGFIHRGIRCHCGHINSAGTIKCDKCGSSLTFLPRFFGLLMMVAGFPGVIGGILTNELWIVVFGGSLGILGLWSFAVMTMYLSWVRRNMK